MTSVAILGAVLVLAAGIRLLNIDAAPLWTDELFTANYPKLGLGFMWTQGIAIEPTPPLYYSIVLFTERVLGDGVVWLRLPSVAGSLLSVGLTWALAIELSGRRWSAILASVIVAIAPQSVFFAQEARTYALQSAAIALALLGFAQYLRGRDRVRSLLLYSVGALSAVYLHPTSAFAVAAINVAAVVALFGRKPLLAGSRLLGWLMANAAVAVLCIPLVSTWLSPNISAAVDWIPKIDRWALESIVGTFLAGHGLEDPAKMIAEVTLPALLVLLLLSRWRPNQRMLIVVVATPCIFLGAMIVISLKRPVLLDRTILWLWVPLAVVLGDALISRVKIASVVVVAALLAALLVQQSKAALLKEDWRFLSQLPPLPGSALIVLGPYSPPAAVARYAAFLSPVLQFDDGRPLVAETIVSQQLFHLPKVTASALRSAIASGRPVCLIYRRPEQAWASQTIASLAPPRLALQDRPGAHPGLHALVW